MPKKAGLYSEIILTIALVVGAALVFGGFLLLRLTEKELLEQKVESARQLVQAVARTSAVDRALRGPSDVSPDTVFGDAFASWQIYDRDYRLVAGSERSPAGLDEALALVREAGLLGAPAVAVTYRQRSVPFVSDEPGHVAIAVPTSVREGRSAVLLARVSLADVADRVVKARNLVFLYVLLYGAVLQAFGVLVLARNVVRPVRRLREATSRVAAGDLTTNVPVAGPGEIADLAVSFNAMTAALEKGREELLRSERMASVGHLSAGMAHEIGNPLGAVIGYLELLKSELEPGRSRELVEHALAEIARIDRLVKDLLDYAAPAKGAAEKVDPAAVLHDAIEIVRYQGAFEGIAFDVDSPQSLDTVRIDPHKLMQVLVNLLLNARDGTGGTGTIHVSGRKDDRHVALTVRDEGEGISEETLQNIFDPFFTTKPQGKGRGLGLTVCHRIVSEAGGKIEVDSKRNVGTTFTIHLPIERDEP